MSEIDKHKRIIHEIRERYGDVVNLQTSPLVLIEIIRNYRNILGADDGTGGVSPVGQASTVAVAGPPPKPPSSSEPERIGIDEVLKTVLSLQKQIDTMDKKLDRISTPRKGV